MRLRLRCGARTTAFVAVALLGLPASAAAVTYTSTDVPKNLGDVVSQPGTATAINDNTENLATATVLSTVTVGAVQVVDIDINHTFPADLDVSLTSPSGTTVELFTDVCGGADWTSANTGFSLDQDAGSVIGASCPPGGASFRPEGNLNAFVGESGGGGWTLRVVDDAGGDVGNLAGWALVILPRTSSNITIPSGPNVRSLAVTGVHISHTFPGDLDISLRSPAGTTVNLVNRKCGTTDWTQGNTGFNLAAGASGLIGSVCPPGANTYAPDGDLGAFAGQSSSGNWTLLISDLAGADTGTLHAWSLQVSDPPDTTITGGPANPSPSSSADFTFTSDIGGSSFQCSLDGAAFTPCSSPASYTGLGNGPHTFAVRAVDGVGNVDASPASTGWDVAVPPPPDSDGDGIPDAQDRCPGQNATARDANRDGCLDFERFTATPKLRATPTRRGVRVKSLSVRAPRGSRVSIRCRRPTRACRRQTKRVGRSRSVSFPRLRGKVLRARTQLDIRVTRPNAIGLFFRYTIRRGNFSRIDRCLQPGISAPRRRCTTF